MGGLGGVPNTAHNQFPSSFAWREVAATSMYVMSSMRPKSKSVKIYSVISSLVSVKISGDLLLGECEDLFCDLFLGECEDLFGDLFLGGCEESSGVSLVSVKILLASVETHDP